MAGVEVVEYGWKHLLLHMVSEPGHNMRSGDDNGEACYNDGKVCSVHNNHNAFWRTCRVLRLDNSHVCRLD